MQYQYEPTGEVRLPVFGELIEVDGEVIRSTDRQPSTEFPIFHRVPQWVELSQSAKDFVHKMQKDDHA